MTRPTSSSLVPAAAIAASLFASAGAALAEPATPDLANWRGPCYNCFNYAVNSKDVFFAQLTPPFTCDNMRPQVVAAGLATIPWAEGDPIPNCPDGCLVALVADIDDADPDNHDFHWYRLNANGRWSHKPGMTPATETSSGGHAPGTWNPTQAAARGNYETFCGFFCIPDDPDLMLNGTRSWQEIIEEAEAARLREADKSGPEDQGVPIPLPELDPLWDHLPFGIPHPDPLPLLLPDPLLPPPLSLQLNPFLVDPTLPPHIMVGGGVVGIYSELEGPVINIQYFFDDRGLEEFLRGFLEGPGGCNPADLAEPFGVIDFNDVVQFLIAFGDGDPAADFAPPMGVLDFNDVVDFLNIFSQGCP